MIGLPGAVPGTRVCRHGHTLTSAADYYYDSHGNRRCLQCRHLERPLKPRACPCGCNTDLTGTRRNYCDAEVKVRQAKKGRQRRRLCVTCHRKKPIEEFRLREVASGVKGARTYRSSCHGCVESGQAPDEDGEPLNPNCPYERAAREIEERYGLPRREWMNRSGNALNDLHYHRMVSINNSGAGAVRVRMDAEGHYNLLAIHRRVKAAGFVPVRQQGKARAATAAVAGLTHMQDQHQEAACA
jgi:hypothetical protein